MGIIYTIGEHNVQHRTNPDAAALRIGDMMVIDVSRYAYQSTIQVPSEALVTGYVNNPPVLVPRAFGRKLDAVRMPPTSQHAACENLVCDTDNADATSAVFVSGSDCEVRNVEQVGLGKALRFDGATRLIAKGIYARNGKQRDKGIYAGGLANRDCHVWNFEILVAAGTSPGDVGGQHGVRVHNHENLKLGHPTDTLGSNARIDHSRAWRFSGFVRDESQYGGAALVLKEGNGATCVKLLIDGTFALEPSPVEEPTKPLLRVNNTVISSCAVYGILHLGAASQNSYIVDSEVFATKIPRDGSKFDPTVRHGACLRLSGNLGTWPAANGRFVNVKFTGPELVETAGKKNLLNFSWNNCYFNGKLIDDSYLAQLSS
jgi:hypothetical protein